MSDSIPQESWQKHLDHLERQVQLLLGRIERIEYHLGIAPEEEAMTITRAAPPPVARPPETALPQLDLTLSPEPSATPQSTMDALHEAKGRASLVQSSAAKESAIDWENLVGRKWALWVGVAAVFMAMVYFLPGVWSHLPNGARLAVGFLTGLAFLMAGELTRTHTARGFSEGMIGGGLAILYLTIWAGEQHYHLLSFDFAFGLMALTTALGVALAVHYDAISLITLSTLGGFLTPVLLRSSGGGASQAGPLLTYIAFLDAGILAVSLFKRWRGIIWLSFASTLLLVSGWAADSYNDTQRWTVFTFISLYFLLFLGASCFYSLIHKEETQAEDLLLLFADALVYAFAGFGLLEPVMGNYPAAFPLILTLFFSGLAITARNLVPQNITLRYSLGGLTILFLTIAIPIQLRQGWIAIAWSVESAIFLTLGLRFQSLLFQRSGQIIWAISLFEVLITIIYAQPNPALLFVDARALPLLVSVLTGGWISLAKHLYNEHSKDSLAPLYAVYTVLAGAWLVAQETYRFFNWHQLPSASTWQAGTLFMIAYLWAVYASGMYAVGLHLRHSTIRFVAIAVGGIGVFLPIWANQTLFTGDWLPFLNLRWLSFVTVALNLGFLGWLIVKQKEHLDPIEFELVKTVPFAVSVVVLWSITAETYHTFRWYQGILGPHWDRTAQMGISLVWTVFATGMLLGGIVKHHRPIRLFALGLFGLTALKVFLFDLSFLDTSYRTLSFGGLGLALIGISWLYNRYGIGREN